MNEIKLNSFNNMKIRIFFISFINITIQIDENHSELLRYIADKVSLSMIA